MGAWGGIKEKPSCESGWYDEALRHLLVQYKESSYLQIPHTNFPTRPPATDERQLFVISSPKRPAQTLKAPGPRCSLLWFVDSLSSQTGNPGPFDSELGNGQLFCDGVCWECACSLRRLQTGCWCRSPAARWGWPCGVGGRGGWARDSVFLP